MTLDRLLGNVSVHVEPFALCLLETGWRLNLPGASEVMFHFVLQGVGVLKGPKGTVHTLQPYWLAVVPRGLPHSLECGIEVKSERTIGGPPPDGSGVVLLQAGSGQRADLQVACGLVRVEYGDSLALFAHLRDVIAVNLSAYPAVRAAFEGILTERANPGPGSAALTEAYMSQCLVYTLRHLSEEAGGPLSWLAALEDPNLGRAVDAMLAEPGHAHTVASLADEALMSRSAFAERFQAAFGCPPMTFLRDVRLRRAAQLLQQPGLSIDRIAHRVGFSSRSHFSQTFTARFGVTPAAYRSGQVDSQ